jgi:hypothetical protein
MVVGGYANGILDGAEFVDMSETNGFCNSPAKYPYPAADAVGFWFHNQPWVCGGESDQTTTRQECYAYNQATDSWTPRSSMKTARVFAAANPIKDGTELWITGGKDGNTLLQSTEILTAAGTWVAGPELPVPLAQHCIVGLDSDRVFISGGIVTADDTTGTKKAYIYSFRTNVWTEIKDMLEARFGHTCQIMDIGDGLEIVATGGWTKRNSDIYQERTVTWRNGPSFDDSKFLSNSLEFEETFVVVGGWGTFQHSIEIWKFNPINITWKKLPQKLKQGRASASSIFVPRSYAQCT